MIDVNAFIAGLKAGGISFVTGVPDSLLKNVCACITGSLPPQQHVIATNEGSAAALAIGHYLATARPALVYMQNSGLGNIVNPVTSLADPLVYAVPMVLMIGWRGEMLADGTQQKDEPQHKKQGAVTIEQLGVLDIPHRIVDANTGDIGAVLRELADQAVQRSGPVALVVRKDSFSPFKGAKLEQDPAWPTREEAIRTILENLPDDAAVVSTTGMASREVFELRKAAGKGHARDFLTVGGMGHASQIAAGIAMAQPGRKVVCIDGDGATLMHAGALAISAGCPNLLHILLNNEAHDSVGGQPTKGNVLNFAEIALIFGYAKAVRVDGIAGLKSRLDALLPQSGSTLIEVRCKTGARADLGRPDRTPVQNKADFMAFLGAKP